MGCPVSTHTGPGQTVHSPPRGIPGSATQSHKIESILLTQLPVVLYLLHSNTQESRMIELVQAVLYAYAIIAGPILLAAALGWLVTVWAEDSAN
jgi:hypothetical protein